MATIKKQKGGTKKNDIFADTKKQYQALLKKKNKGMLERNVTEYIGLALKHQPTEGFFHSTKAAIEFGKNKAKKLKKRIQASQKKGFKFPKPPKKKEFKFTEKNKKRTGGFRDDLIEPSIEKI